MYRVATYASPMPLRLAEHPAHDRPRERLWSVGPAALTGQELLAILLGTGSAGRDALAVAGDVLARVDGSLRRLAGRPSAELAKVPGVGRTKAARVAAVGKPNHPSYPSGHSCISSSAAAVLTTFFPEQRRELGAMVTEAGLSRMYGGIHYGFDIEAGQQLGRSVARFTMRADRSGHSVLTPDTDHERHGGR